MDARPAAGGDGSRARTDAPLRVLMIGWEFPPQASDERAAARDGLVRELLSFGCRIALVVPGRPRARPAAAPRSAGGSRALPFRVLRVETGAASGREGSWAAPEDPALPRAVLEWGRNVAQACRREEFDLIHAHDWMTFPAALELHRISGKPWIAHVHATEFARRGEEGSRFIVAVERESTRRADRVVCVSRWTAAVVHRRYGVPDRAIRVVHAAIDSGVSEKRAPFPHDRPLVLFAGRLTRQKAPASFLEAARRVLDERPDAEFVLAGDGDRRQWLEGRARDLGIADRVAFTGPLDPERLSELFRRASVYALPSVTEPFGLTVLEALRAGVPAIVSRNAGVTEVVRSVVPIDAGDGAGLAARILFLLDSPVYRWRLTRHASAEVARLSWRQAAERWLRIYDEVC